MVRNKAGNIFIESISSPSEKITDLVIDAKCIEINQPNNGHMRIGCDKEIKEPIRVNNLGVPDGSEIVIPNGQNRVIGKKALLQNLQTVQAVPVVFAYLIWAHWAQEFIEKNYKYPNSTESILLFVFEK